MNKYPTLKIISIVFLSLLIGFCFGMSYDSFLNQKRWDKNVELIQHCKEQAIKEAKSNFSSDVRGNNVEFYIDWIILKEVNQ